MQIKTGLISPCIIALQKPLERLRMNCTISGIPLPDKDRERLNRIKTAIAAGTYHIDAGDVAAKLILSMLEFGDNPSSLSDWVNDDAERSD
jgi:Anti-sigma-28 factor, FlgM